MKKDNNLYHVIYKGKEYWFTKLAYITLLTNLQWSQLQRIQTDEEYRRRKQISIELEDASEVKYKNINVF